MFSEGPKTPIKHSRASEAVHEIMAGLAMFGLWVSLSGKLDRFHLLMGVLSALIVARLTGPLLTTRVHGQKGTREEYLTSHPGMWLRFWAYVPWLIREVILANIHVALLVLRPKSALDPLILRFGTNLDSDLSQTTLANSITLTPGTITIEVEESGEFLVHAITPAAAQSLMTLDMQSRVGRIFKLPKGQDLPRIARKHEEMDL
ncbi:MAG: Na+/H+ antiporter subunit E [Candidatus Omnitrophica bacterium]|nr:Na+/H+ antiporter subunit E [Candidatus Omnitrophota bacterium]